MNDRGIDEGAGNLVFIVVKWWDNPMAECIEKPCSSNLSHHIHSFIRIYIFHCIYTVLIEHINLYY